MAIHIRNNQNVKSEVKISMREMTNTILQERIQMRHNFGEKLGWIFSKKIKCPLSHLEVLGQTTPKHALWMGLG